MLSSAANWHSALLYVKCPSAQSNDLLCNKMSFCAENVPLHCQMYFYNVECLSVAPTVVLCCKRSFCAAKCYLRAIKCLSWTPNVLLRRQMSKRVVQCPTHALPNGLLLHQMSPILFVVHLANTYQNIVGLNFRENFFCTPDRVKLQCSGCLPWDRRNNRSVILFFIELYYIAEGSTPRYSKWLRVVTFQTQYSPWFAHALWGSWPHPSGCCTPPPSPKG